MTKITIKLNDYYESLDSLKLITITCFYLWREMFILLFIIYNILFSQQLHSSTIFHYITRNIVFIEKWQLKKIEFFKKSFNNLLFDHFVTKIFSSSHNYYILLLPISFQFQYFFNKAKLGTFLVIFI